MKKKTLLNATIIILLIIMGATLVIAGFIKGKADGFGTIGIMSFVYSIILLLVKK